MVVTWIGCVHFWFVCPRGRLISRSGSEYSDVFERERERERESFRTRSFPSLESFLLLSLEGKQAILWRWIRPAFRFYKVCRTSLAIMSPIPIILQSPVLTAFTTRFNPLNAELNPICHLLALLGGATIVVVSRLRVKIRKLYVLFIQCFCFVWFSYQPVVISLYNH